MPRCPAPAGGASPKGQPLAPPFGGPGASLVPGWDCSDGGVAILVRLRGRVQRLAAPVVMHRLARGGSHVRAAAFPAPERHHRTAGGPVLRLAPHRGAGAGSMHLASLQLPMLESYLKSPQVHTAASSNPDLRGGYFVNIPESRSGEIRELVEAIKRDRAPMLRLAEAIGEAEALLRQEANGFDLTPLYAKLPKELAGVVELAYDCGRPGSCATGRTRRCARWPARPASRRRRCAASAGACSAATTHCRCRAGVSTSGTPLSRQRRRRTARTWRPSCTACSTTRRCVCRSPEGSCCAGFSRVRSAQTNDLMSSTRCRHTAPTSSPTSRDPARTPAPRPT
jgi:hypothetical protein